MGFSHLVVAATTLMAFALLIKSRTLRLHSGGVVGSGLIWSISYYVLWNETNTGHGEFGDGVLFDCCTFTLSAFHAVFCLALIAEVVRMALADHGKDQ